MTGPAVHIALDPRQLARVVAIGAAVLVVLGAGTIVLRFGLGHDYVYGLLPKFDLDRELNVPTWYSSTLLLIAATLLALVAIGRHAAADRFARHWFGLAAIFVLLSMDETASIHGLPGRYLRAAFDLPGFLHFAWVIPASLAVLIFGLAYARFTWNLPARTRTLFIAAGLVYVGGALGGEMVQGAYQAAYGQDHWRFAAVALIEESMEMGGAVLFIYAVADDLARHHGEVRIALGPRMQRAADSTPGRVIRRDTPGPHEDARATPRPRSTAPLADTHRG